MSIPKGGTAQRFEAHHLKRMVVGHKAFINGGTL